MTKEGDHLGFDFGETADQAPAVINFARSMASWAVSLLR